MAFRKSSPIFINYNNSTWHFERFSVMLSSLPSLANLCLDKESILTQSHEPDLPKDRLKECDGMGGWELLISTDAKATCVVTNLIGIKVHFLSLKTRTINKFLVLRPTLLTTIRVIDTHRKHPWVNSNKWQASELNMALYRKSKEQGS